MAATDLVRNAARSANLEYGNEVVDIYDDYAPYGYWDDTIVFEKSKLESNLTTVKTELERLADQAESEQVISMTPLTRPSSGWVSGRFDQVRVAARGSVHVIQKAKIAQEILTMSIDVRSAPALRAIANERKFSR